MYLASQPSNSQHVENGRTELGVIEMEPLPQTSQLQDEALVAQRQEGRFRIDTFWLEEINAVFEELCLGQKQASIRELFQRLQYNAYLYNRDDCPSYSTVRRIFHSTREEKCLDVILDGGQTIHDQ